MGLLEQRQARTGVAYLIVADNVLLAVSNFACRLIARFLPFFRTFKNTCTCNCKDIFAVSHDCMVLE